MYASSGAPGRFHEPGVSPLHQCKCLDGGASFEPPLGVMDLAQVRWRVDIAGPTAPDPQGPLPPPTALGEAPILG